MTELKERILSYMREAAYKPLTDAELAGEMKLTDEELVAFWPAMEELEKTAAIIKNRNELFGVPERMNLVVGRLSMSAKGFGFIQGAHSSNVFFHVRDYRGATPPAEGMRVEFEEIQVGGKGPRAMAVRPLGARAAAPAPARDRKSVV